ncbi:MAG: 50S ribosomal protein L16 [Candidatus Nanoarchaeia archaeon]|nr:50S ribosomal protein L16 [Candidatus Haiyanarchaeum thermophilum]MCW1302909.1 50S ribosomal protein L16 [Candidatus Haiyanarchaeum thermophilum]MCW1303588.1 50S ribosomal protein L16 [Candidatus Haiyanarchaeum thermophilum]MCW1306270.1 50S ribosomal protein L16 [Candidatus Haiyanarchaeum thermophilum]MCW1307891.1 50S ribosomal protein L16 [Candidatus Haiyanarchaeum thermophilum]
MVRLKPARVYRTPKRPYVRVSRLREKSYITGVPPLKLRVFEMGNKQGEFEKKVSLVSNAEMQIRENALEAARVTANKFLEKNAGIENYFMRINVYPHQVLREHSFATVAGADRFQRGMSLAFGKPCGRAARVRKDQELIIVKTSEKYVEIAKEALKRAAAKLPGNCKVVIS